VYPIKTLATAGLVTILGSATGVSLYSLSRERLQTTELAATNQSLTTMMAKMETHLDEVSRKLAELQNQQIAPVPPEPVRNAVRLPRRVARKPAVATRPADDSRLDQLRARVNEQEQELAGTKDQLQQTRVDLQGRLDSTRDELNGSIARTHDDVVALQKRGERNYYEFDADKSKQFQKVGPIRLSLRKVDVKHKRYDLVLMVDDFEIQKKSVNMFEPVWIMVADRPQPLELVVNRVHKDQVGGYLSEPKYKTSELAAANSSTPGQRQ
jgi:hypothetical protein